MKDVRREIEEKARLAERAMGVIAREIKRIKAKKDLNWSDFGDVGHVAEILGNAECFITGKGN